MTELAQRRCEACLPGTQPIDAKQAAELHKMIDPAWELKEDRIIRKLKFKNFRDPMGMAVRVAMIAEEEGHHPDLKISWGQLRISLTTHVAKGLTPNDFIMAAKIDALKA